VGFAVLLGPARIHERAKEMPAPPTSKALVEAVATSAPAAAPHAAAAPATARERTEPPPAREAPPGLPRYEVLGLTASPDGKSWCILSVSLEERVSQRPLRALWASLKEEQATAWDRFTCRVYLHDMDCFGDSWADVNEMMIFGGLAPTPVIGVEEEEEEGRPVLVFEGDCCFLSVGGREFNIPRDSITWIRGPRGPLAEITYPEPLDDEWKAWEWKTVRIPVSAEDASLPLPRCGGVWFR
jgi:hypothetical protein